MKINGLKNLTCGTNIKQKEMDFKGFGPENKKAMAQKIKDPKFMIGPFRLLPPTHNILR
jgi:hypothetical protein